MYLIKQKKDTLHFVHFYEENIILSHANKRETKIKKHSKHCIYYEYTTQAEKCENFGQPKFKYSERILRKCGEASPIRRINSNL